MTDQLGTAASILSADDLSNRVRVDVPEWGCHVFVRQIASGERDEFEAKIAELRDAGKPLRARARFAILVCCDADGRPLFEAKHLAPLNEKNGAALDRIYRAGSKLNRWLESDDDIEGVEKNSEAADASDSP